MKGPTLQALKQQQRDNLRHAVRSFNTALCRSEQLAAQEEGACADRAFDGGEFSGAFHYNAVDQIMRKIAQRIAKAHDINTDQLLSAHQAWMWDAQEAEFNARAITFAPVWNATWND